MVLHVSIFAALTDHSADPFDRENVACVSDIVERYDVQKFDTDTILYGDTWCKKMDISMFLVRFWFKLGKICKNASYFFIFTFFADILCFFSRARLTPGEGVTGKYPPQYQSPYQPST